MLSIFISGGSGFLGKLLLPKLLKNDHKITLIGRSKLSNTECLPYSYLTYDEYFNNNYQCDIFLNLAAINNNNYKNSFDEYKNINCDLVKKLIEKNLENKNNTFYAFNSFHSLDLKNKSNYAITKRMQSNEIEIIKNCNVKEIFLPIVYGNEFSGNLKFVKYIPKVLRNYFLNLISSIKPTVTVDKVYKKLLDNQKENRNKPIKKIFLSNDINKNFYYKIFNYITNYFFALTILLLFWWLLILLCIVIRIDSKGSPIFKQMRVGLNGKNFTCYKLRTMKIETENIETQKVSKNSITRFGRYLRSTKIDEIPQIINILKGEMSLIGPRPGLPSQIELLKKRNELNVLNLKPGITGLSQINNIDMSNPKKLAESDRNYIYLRSILIDIKIVFLTIFGRGHGDKVSKSEANMD